jgi:hypothetical protein
LLWQKITHAYVITDVAGIETLAQCCQMLDRAEAIAEEIARDGVVLRTPRGARAHSGVKEELMCRAFVVKTLEKLGLMHENVHPTAGRQPDGRGAGVTFLPQQRGEE